MKEPYKAITAIMVKIDSEDGFIIVIMQRVIKRIADTILANNPTFLQTHLNVLFIIYYTPFIL